MIYFILMIILPDGSRMIQLSQSTIDDFTLLYEEFPDYNVYFTDYEGKLLIVLSVPNLSWGLISEINSIMPIFLSGIDERELQSFNFDDNYHKLPE